MYVWHVHVYLVTFYTGTKEEMDKLVQHSLDGKYHPFPDDKCVP